MKRADGSIKKVLKFTASSIDIKDLHQLTTGPVGTTGHVTCEPRAPRRRSATAR
ncbi:hypothetical protein SMICM304S_01781 [Streptomyces microflavus]